MISLDKEGVFGKYSKYVTFVCKRVKKGEGMGKSKQTITAFGVIMVLVMVLLSSNTVAFATDSTKNSETSYLVDGELPSSVDLSEDEYFPAIGDQSFNGNCGYWSGYYTSFTYAYNKKHGIKTTPETSHNPIFGFAFYGRSLEGDATIAMQIGYPTMGVLPLDHYGTNTFSPTKEVWEDALKHRTGGWEDHKKFGEEDSIVTGPKDSSLNQIKELLAKDKVVGVGSLSAKWNYSIIGDGPHKGESIIDRCDGEGYGGHGISFVGYDDDIWVDINHDGQKQQAEFGAFKMVNSWGPDWKNGGFVWVAYDALNVVSQVLTAADETRINNAIATGSISGGKVNSSSRSSYFMYNTVSTLKLKEKDTSDCLCYMTVNTGSRKQMKMSVTATNKKDGTKATYNFPSLVYDSKNYAWDGTEKCTDATMVFDLDNLISDISSNTMEDYTWEVTFGDDTLDEYALIVKDVYFGVNGTKKYVTTVSNIPLNGNSRTYKMNLRTPSLVEDSDIVEENKKNVTIYYSNSSYKDANIHYRVGNGTWTAVPGIKMSVNNEQSGYTWKYVVNLGKESGLTICFNNGNNVWDNNGSKDYTISGAGCYGIKDGKITKLEEIVVEPDPVIELDKQQVSVNVGDKATVTASIWPASMADKTVTWESSNTKVATVEDGVITGVSAGTTMVTATLAKGVTATVEVTVSLVVDNKLSGLCKSSDGIWYYYKNGEVDKTYTGMAKNVYGWWYVKNGKIDFTYTGMAKNTYGWWYMKNGKLDFTYTGMAKNTYGWWYMKDGKLDLTYTGMAKNVYGWWYMKEGRLDLTYTGISTNKYGWWYMKNGKLDLTYTGKATYNGVTYDVVEGQVIK